MVDGIWFRSATAWRSTLTSMEAGPPWDEELSERREIASPMAGSSVANFTPIPCIDKYNSFIDRTFQPFHPDRGTPPTQKDVPFEFKH